MAGRVLGALLVVSCPAMVVLGWSAGTSVGEARTFSDRTLRLAELKGVVQLDGLLTMTARMAAATGGAAMEGRVRGPQVGPRPHA